MAHQVAYQITTGRRAIGVQVAVAGRIIPDVVIRDSVMRYSFQDALEYLAAFQFQGLPTTLWFVPIPGHMPSQNCLSVGFEG